MTDPAEVKVGSELVFRGRVESVQPNGVLVRFGNELASSPGRTFMSDSEVRVAEHIPPPKTFKRGDWVKWAGGKGGRHGFVVGASGNGVTPVSWPDTLVIARERSEDLEPDEAPE